MGGVLFAAACLAAPLAAQTECYTVTGSAGAVWNVYHAVFGDVNLAGALPGEDEFCLEPGCYYFAMQASEGGLVGAGLIGPDGQPLELSGYADATYYQTTFTVGGTLGCGDPSACNFDPTVTCTAYSECIYDCYGCTDPAAFNYQPEALLDNGTCCTSHWATVESDVLVQVYLYGVTGSVVYGVTGSPFCLAEGCYQFSAYSIDSESTDFQVVLEDGSVWMAGNTLDFSSNMYNPVELNAVLGCTYQLACNYDAAATCDDGSCEYTSCAGCMSPTASNYDPEATFDDGTCCFGDVGTVTADGPGYWSLWGQIGGGSYGVLPESGVVCLAPGCLVFSCSAYDFTMPPLSTPVTFTLTGPDGALLATLTTDAFGEGTTTFTYGDVVLGCIDSGACNFNPDATCPDWEMCDYGCYGCTDPTASNFNPEATLDIGSCCYGPWYTVEATGPIEWWWTSGDGLQYQGGYGTNGFCYTGSCFQLHAWSLTSTPFDLTITAPDGSIFYASEGNINPYLSEFFDADQIVGCTDPGACNFNSAATCADYMLCDYSCYGCTDPAAPNFNPDATFDNGSCCTDAAWYTVEATGDLLFFSGHSFGNYPYHTGFCSLSECFLFQTFSYALEPVSYTVTGPDGNVVASGTVESYFADDVLIGSEGEVPGCTDPTACNYDEAATCDPGVCVWYCGGCLDPSALNFFPDAEYDDGTCMYGLETPNIGMVLVPDGDQFYVAANWTGLSSTYAVVPSDGTAAWMAADDGTALHGPYPCDAEVAFTVHDMQAGMAVAMTSPTFTLACGAAGVAGPDPGYGAVPLRAFPNPTAAALTIDGLPAGAAWSVVDRAGRRVATGLHAGGLLTLDASVWPTGLYLLHSAGRTVKFDVQR
jgi:hypothetical protein